MSLLEILMRGGWIMVFIALSSVVVIALGIGRFLTLRREHRRYKMFLHEWIDPSTKVDPVKFVAISKDGPRAIAEMAAALRRGKYTRREADSKVEAMAGAELARFETGLGTIATLAAATPLLGFLGTVTGMIRAFMQIQNLGGNVNANVLAGGIWEALVTTAAGLTVGIIALIIHNYLAVMVGRLAHYLEQACEVTLKIMSIPDET
ncbi:MotA/TolQ/ExbB proton channel family protein [bacterium]|nr:MotA/TolQ/ExbB proton channel family protein [bacterium]